MRLYSDWNGKVGKSPSVNYEILYFSLSCTQLQKGFFVDLFCRYSVWLHIQWKLNVCRMFELVSVHYSANEHVRTVWAVCLNFLFYKRIFLVNTVVSANITGKLSRWMLFSCKSLRDLKKIFRTSFLFLLEKSVGERVGEGFKIEIITLLLLNFFCRLYKAAERWREKSIWAFDGRDRRERKIQLV